MGLILSFKIICILDHFFPFISALCSTNCIGLYSEDISHTEPKLQIDLLALYGAMKARTTKCLHYCCYTEYDYYIHIVLVSKALVVLCSIWKGLTLIKWRGKGSTYIPSTIYVVLVSYYSTTPTWSSGGWWAFSFFNMLSLINIELK